MKNDKNKPEEQEEILDEQIAEGVESRDEDKEKLTQELEEAGLKYKRALADYQNLQKRVSEEKGEWIRSANKELLLRLLPVLDTLMLAEKHLKDAPSGGAGQGLTVSISHFLDILKAEGVIKIKTIGENFDPVQMECVMTEEGKENKVLEELRAGYILYDKVLRPAQVKVGKEL